MFFERVRQLWFRLASPKPPRTIERAVRLAPVKEELVPDRHFQRWLNDPHPMLNSDSPPVKLKVISLGGRTVDELVELFNPDYVIHAGHEEEKCTGKSASEGITDILCSKPSSWEIRMAKAGIAYEPVMHRRSLIEVLKRCPRVTYKPVTDHLAKLDIFIAQEFHGSEPGRPNRDFCDFYIDHRAAGLELQLDIPYPHVINDYLVTGYLRIIAKADAEKGIILLNHSED